MEKNKRITAMKLARSIMFPIAILFFVASITVIVFFLGVIICCDDIITENVVSATELHEISLYYGNVLSIAGFSLGAVGAVLIMICADLRLRIESAELGIHN